MGKFYSLELEVAGELGANTSMDSSVHPPLVFTLHFIFSGWRGDDLLECFPCYIATEALMQEIKNTQPSGCVFDEMIIEKSEQFNELYPNTMLPNFKWLKVQGEAGKDDFGISSDNFLIVSERILKILKNFNLNECEIEEWKV
ncbi:MAG: hypothetical protein GY710_26385 [Desulfobacteraceae bacterium]|nr:hypothetical protein [Desulfobacteraceae bacterium]